MWNQRKKSEGAAGVVSIVIPGYAEQFGFELDQYQVYARFILLDTVTGYRSQYQDYATLIPAREGSSRGAASLED